jgi:hypothetical protein
MILAGAYQATNVRDDYKHHIVLGRTEMKTSAAPATNNVFIVRKKYQRNTAS